MARARGAHDVVKLPNPQERNCLQAREEAKAKMGLAEVPEKSLTVPRPFNLTKPSIRKVPEPMKIEQVSHQTEERSMGTILATLGTVRVENSFISHVSMVCTEDFLGFLLHLGAR